MREQIESVVEELRQLKAEGVEAVYFEQGTLDALASLVPSQTEARDAVNVPAAGGAQPEAAAAEPVVSEPVVVAEPQEKEVAKVESKEQKPASVVQAKRDKGRRALPDWVKPIPEPAAFELPDGDARVQWDWLQERVMNDPVCNEHVCKDKGRKVVFGVGDIGADIFFCGEAPGEDEEIQGEPFVGKAGQLLNKIIGAMGLAREKVYIGNIMNWRPEHDKPWGNRPPTETELNYCLPYLEAQVRIVKPKVVVALGATAANGLLGYDPGRTVGRTRGRWLDYQGVPLLLTYHPAYLLRNNTNRAKRMVWEDMMLAMEKIGLPISEKQRSYFL